MLIVLVSEIFERLNILNLVENLSEVFHDISAEDLNIFQFDELKQL